MSSGATLGWLLATTSRNFVVSQLRRLRRPGYLVSVTLAVGYWGLLRPGPAPESLTRLPAFALLADHAEQVGTFAVALFALLAWLVGQPAPRLAFNDAEVQFLFAAPIARRPLVHYALVKELLLTPVVVAATTLFARRGWTGATATFGIAMGVAFATLGLHWHGAAFARAWLRTRVRGRGLRSLQLGAFALLAAVAGSAVAGVPEAAAALSWLLWPARALVRPALAQGATPFLPAIAPAIGLLVLHYVWVLTAADHFEDAAVERAARLTRLTEARSAGLGAALAGAARPIAFRLPSWATPELAIAWKGLVAISRIARIFVIFALLVLALTAGGFLLVTSSRTAIHVIAGVLAGMILLFTALVGPAATGGGLTGDLSRLDLLRTFPLSGARLVFGQALAPSLLLAILWIGLAPVLPFLFPGRLGGLERGFLAAALTLVGPPTLFLGVLLQAAVVLLLPAWSSAGMGIHLQVRFLVANLVHLVGLPILALPAAIPAAVVIVLGVPRVGWGAVLAGGLVATAVLAFEIALALIVTGWLFERLDPADL